MPLRVASQARGGGGPACAWISPEASPAAGRLALATGIAMRLWHDEESVTFGVGEARPEPDVSAFAAASVSRDVDHVALLCDERFQWEPPL
jgi:hypothetical protein